MNRFAFILLLLLLTTGTRAQQLHIEQYTPANGLLDTRVVNMFQDNRGLVYFLTWEGISIFDGQRFQNISTYNGEALGLVYEMMQWKNDTCYVFSFQRGVHKLVQAKLYEDTLFHGITEIYRVLNTGNNQWIVISNTGIYKWNGPGSRPRPLAGGIKDVDFAIVKNNHLVFSRQQGKILNIMDLGSERITASLAGVNIGGLVCSEQSPAFVLLNGRWVQMNSSALQKGEIKTGPLFFAEQVPPGYTIRGLYPVQHNIWLQDVQNGWLLLNNVTGEKEQYPARGSINTNASWVFSDRENNYWFSTFHTGIQKCAYTRLNPFQPTPASTTQTLNTNEYGEAIVSEGEQGFQVQKNKMRTLGRLPGPAQFSFHWQDKLWSLTEPYTIRSSRGDIIELQNVNSKDTSHVLSRNITFDQQGRLLLCGSTLYVIEKDLRVHTASLPYFTDNMVVNAQNHYYAFSRNGSVSTFSMEQHRLVKQPGSLQIPNFSPRYALHWNADTFCIGTRHTGIVWLKLANGKAMETGRLNTATGLSNAFVLSLMKKNNQLLYASTGTGFDEIILGGNDTIVQNLAAANNLYVSFSTVIKNNEEQILTCSAAGRLYAVSNPAAGNTGFTPAIWLSEITVNGKTVTTPEHRFNHNQNNFRFTVTAPCFTNAGNLRYEFLLSSGAGTWQQHSANNFYNINNLSPGSYTLTVTVIYPGKIYPDKKITWRFSITPPFWKQWWFILLLVLTAATGIWALVRNYYMRRLRLQQAEAAKQQAVEKERNRISRDMHDDLGSGLTKIAILSEVAKKRLGEPEKAREQLEKISVSSRELVDNLQDIIWVLNPRNDTLESLAAYTREYALKYFEPLEVKVSFNYPETFSHQKISEEKRRNVFLTIKESLHNIAKHAWCNQVTIDIEEDIKVFRIVITDDGRGFDPEQVRFFANGIKNMHNRIAQSGGQYQIYSEPGKGARVTIEMPV